MPKITVGDIQLYYEMTGAGPPLLFIHGLGSSSRDWEKQVAFFSEMYRILAFDIRGHPAERRRGAFSQPAGIAATLTRRRPPGL